jgi:hypothetical protein
MSNKTATKTESNSSVTPVSNHPHLFNWYTKKQKDLNENQEFNKLQERFNYHNNW